MTRLLPTLVALPALALSAGCAHQTLQPKHPSEVESALASASSRIASSWVTLGGVQEAQHPASVDYLGDYNGVVPPALQTRVEMQWAGPLADLIGELASYIGWQYEKVGLMPPGGVPVFVDSKDQTIAQILREVGYQAGSRADVIVKPDEMRLEVVYD